MKNKELAAKDLTALNAELTELLKTYAKGYSATDKYQPIG
jgi:hypothetical protein